VNLKDCYEAELPRKPACKAQNVIDILRKGGRHGISKKGGEASALFAQSTAGNRESLF